ncbi:MAG: alpha/beta hydrolase family protein [Anaerolineales bacterium]
MRPIEITILTTMFVDVFLRMTGLRSRWRWPILLPMLALFLVGVHLISEGYRWQMWPAYVLATGLSLPTLRILREHDDLPRLPYSRMRAIATGTVTLLLLAVAAFLPWAMPVPRVPAATGPYAVGTVTQHLVDSARRETYSGRSDEPRELMVQLWYPVEPPAPAAARAPYLDHIDVIGPALAESVGLPALFLDHVALSLTDAVLEADVSRAETSYPVVVFSHGWTSIRSLHTTLAMELASHGYVVVGIDHPYGAAVTVFPDGRAVFVNEEALPFGAPDEEFQRAANTLADVWATDVQFVLDTLASANKDDPRFGGRLDLGHVGMFGHSTGGGSMLEFCARDDRCTALLAMDAWFPPVSDAVLSSGIPQPLLFMHSEVWSTAVNDALRDRFLAAQTAETYELTIAGTQHYDFTDTGLLTPFAPRLGLRKGPIDAERGLRIVNAYALAFFDSFLKGAPSDLLAGPSAEYPEVDLRK